MAGARPLFAVRDVVERLVEFLLCPRGPETFFAAPVATVHELLPLRLLNRAFADAVPAPLAYIELLSHRRSVDFFVRERALFQAWQRAVIVRVVNDLALLAELQEAGVRTMAILYARDIDADATRVLARCPVVVVAHAPSTITSLDFVSPQASVVLIQNSKLASTVDFAPLRNCRAVTLAHCGLGKDHDLSPLENVDRLTLLPAAVRLGGAS